MSDVDTSAEAVERLADEVFGVSLAHKARSTCCGECDQSGTCAAPACHFGNVMRALQDSSDTLRTLLAERDELRAEIERLRQALKFYACDCAKLGDECGERLNDVLCGNTAREALKEKENDQ